MLYVRYIQKGAKLAESPEKVERHQCTLRRTLYGVAAEPALPGEVGLRRMRKSTLDDCTVRRESGERVRLSLSLARRCHGSCFEKFKSKSARVSQIQQN